MYLKRIELAGFKSFADKIRMALHDQKVFLLLILLIMQKEGHVLNYEYQNEPRL